MVVENTDEKMLILKLFISLSTANLICILQKFLWSYLSLKKAIGSPNAKEKTEIVHLRFFWIGKGGVRDKLFYIKSNCRVRISILFLNSFSIKK